MAKNKKNGGEFTSQKTAGVTEAGFSADGKKMTREVNDSIHNGHEVKAPEGTAKLSPKFDGQNV